MPHPIDKLVGSRIRQARWVKGMTQHQLGDAAGCRFQQIQKYETGTNRVSASRLWEIARALEMPMTYFFEAEEQAKEHPSLDRENAEILRVLGELSKTKRRAVLSLAKSIAKDKMPSFPRE